jgi:hypothetical protein
LRISGHWRTNPAAVKGSSTASAINQRQKFSYNGSMVPRRARPTTKLPAHRRAARARPACGETAERRSEESQCAGKHLIVCERLANFIRGSGIKPLP